MTDMKEPVVPVAALQKPRRFRLVSLLVMGALVVGGTALVSVNQGAFADRGSGMMGHHGQGDHGRGDHGPAGMMGMMGGRHLDRMMDRVDATEDQRGKIRDIARAARNDVEKLTDVLRPLRKAAIEQLTAPTLNPAGVEGVRTRLSGVTDEISKRVTTAMIDVAQVLTPEQRAKIGEEMNSRRRGPMAK